jgi:hypothetical protein
MFRLLIRLGCAGAVASVWAAQVPPSLAQAPEGAFAVSFVAGSRDNAGRLMGGTEMRVLAVHAGKLYAGNGYWEDQPGPEGLQGAQILVLDGPGARWRVDHGFDERMPDGRPRDLAVSTLEEVTFATDGSGRRLPAPMSLLIAANWDLTGTARVFARDDATGAWAAATLAQDRPAPGFLPQVRSLAGHRDRVTGIDRDLPGFLPATTWVRQVTSLPMRWRRAICAWAGWSSPIQSTRSRSREMRGARWPRPLHRRSSKSRSYAQTQPNTAAELKHARWMCRDWPYRVGSMSSSATMSPGTDRG